MVDINTAFRGSLSEEEDKLTTDVIGLSSAAGINWLVTELTICLFSSVKVGIYESSRPCSDVITVLTPIEKWLQFCNNSLAMIGIINQIINNDFNHKSDHQRNFSSTFRFFVFQLNIF